MPRCHACLSMAWGRDDERAFAERRESIGGIFNSMSHLMSKQAASFKLPDIHDATWSMSDFRDHWLLLVFHRHLA